MLETPSWGNRLRKIPSAPLSSLRRLCLWIPCHWPEGDHNPSAYLSTEVSSQHKRWLTKKSAQTRLHCHFLSYFTIYAVGKKKKKIVEVKATAQRLQDVLLHLSSDAGEWLTQNIWWSETIMFFFLSHISSWKFQAFRLWNMVKGDILKLYVFKERMERIRKLSLSLKAYHSPDKNHVIKMCLPISESSATRKQMASSRPLEKVLPRSYSLTWIICWIY